MARNDEGSATIASVERAADVLLHFATVPETDLGITDIAEALEMPKAAVHRILASLRSRGLVELDRRTRRYSLGAQTLRLGRAYLDKFEVRAAARPLLEELSRVTGETVTLSVPVGERSRVYVDQVVPDREVVMTVRLGQLQPLHAGASSRVLLAFQSPERIASYLAEPLERLTEATVIDPGTLRQDLTAIRSLGWAQSAGERKEGAAALAAPVLDESGHALAVVSVCGPAERFRTEVDGFRDPLLEVTRELSRRAGGHVGQS